MAQALIPVQYTDSHGKTQTTTIVRGKPLKRREENFCRLVASGDEDPFNAYLKAFEIELTKEKGEYLAKTVTAMMGRGDIIIRLQQLRSPVIKEVAQKYTYNLNQAMHELQMSWDLAVATAHVPSMIKITELRARLHKMLSEQIDVKHTHGFLDEAATTVLLEMKKTLEEQKARKKLTAITVESKEVEE